MFSLTVADYIATLTMNNPPVNAMSDEWIAAFHTRLDELTERHDWSVLHIRNCSPGATVTCQFPVCQFDHGAPRGPPIFA